MKQCRMEGSKKEICSFSGKQQYLAVILTRFLLSWLMHEIVSPRRKRRWQGGEKSDAEAIVQRIFYNLARISPFKSTDRRFKSIDSRFFSKIIPGDVLRRKTMDIIMFSGYLPCVRARCRQKVKGAGTLAGYILCDIINLGVVIAFFP